MGHDLTEEEYQRRRKRAKRVSYFTGIFSVGVFAVLLFVFLWNFWLEDLFRTAERVDVPDFTGKSYEAVVNDKQYSDYRFTVVYTVDPRCRTALSFPGPGRRKEPYARAGGHQCAAHRQHRRCHGGGAVCGQ